MIPRTLGEVAALCGADLRVGSPEDPVSGVAPLDMAAAADVSFYANTQYRSQLRESRARAIVVKQSDAALDDLAGRALLVVDDPYAAFAKIAQAFHPRAKPEPLLDPAARVEPTAKVDISARIEAFAFIGAGATVGSGTWIMSGAYVGPGASIGKDTVLYPRVVVRERCVVGDGCILQPGVVIGADGFGFAFDGAGDGDGPIHRKIPQTGIVRIEDDVEIGANSCVDRATFGETVIGRGTKIDNLVQVAHNVTIGPMSLLAAQVGISGSTKVGAGVAIGGQAGIAGHLHIGDMARIGGQSGVGHDIPDGGAVSGSPAFDHRVWLRAVTAFPRLPDVLRELRKRK